FRRAAAEAEDARADVAVEVKPPVEVFLEERTDASREAQPEGAVAPGRRGLEAVERDGVDARPVEELAGEAVGQRRGELRRDDGDEADDLEVLAARALGERAVERGEVDPAGAPRLEGDRRACAGLLWSHFFWPHFFWPHFFWPHFFWIE